MNEEFEKFLKKNRGKIPQFMRDTPTCREVLQNIFAAGQAAEREALQAKLDDLSVWCEAVQADIVYCYQIDEMIRKRGEVTNEC